MDLAAVTWRVGGSVGRTIYAVTGAGGHEHARDDEAVLIGMMDTPELAAEACEAHNWRLGIHREAQP
jgi:hypothetical protein